MWLAFPFFFHKYVSESFSILLFLTLSDANRKQNSDRKQVAAKLSREIASKVNPDEKSSTSEEGEDYFFGLHIPDFCMKIKMGLMTSVISDPRCDPLYMTPNCNYKNTEGCWGNKDIDNF